MTLNFVVVKSLDPPETVSDPLDLNNDVDFTADDYQKLAERICTNVTWSAGAGKAEISGCQVSLEPTDACLFLNFVQSDVPPDVIHTFVASTIKMGAVTMSADTGDILSEGPLA
jgi:hypothetical protein